MQEHYLFYPNLDSSLRKNKRAMLHEVNRLNRKLSEVEVIMGKNAFNPFISYKDAYDVGMALWQKVLEGMDPKYITINKDYFRLLYKPIPQGFVSEFIHNLHELFRHWGSLIPRNSDDE